MKSTSTSHTPELMLIVYSELLNWPYRDSASLRYYAAMLLQQFYALQREGIDNE